jgi:hypothetical protein
MGVEEDFMRSKKICLCLLLIMLVSMAASCDDKKSGDIDMKKFIEKMQKENNVSTDKKREIRKSIFPNLKEKD